MEKAEVQVAFETDLNPHRFNRFMANFDPLSFYVNYDIGNSPSLGHKPCEEFDAIGDRVANVYVKDRNLQGTTSNEFRSRLRVSVKGSDY